MVCEDNNFIGTPNNSFFKPPADDDEIDFYIPAAEVNDVMVEDSIYIITDDEELDELYDDASYVTDTYDEDDYYFSEDEDDDDDDEVEDVYLSEANSYSEDTMGESVSRITVDSDASNSTSASTNTTEKLQQPTTQLDQNGTENKG